MTPIDRDLSIDMAAVMAACRLTLSPGDGQALADLRCRAGQMAAVTGESAARQAFRVAAQVCATDPSPAHVTALRGAMHEFNRGELLPFAPPPEDGRGRRERGPAAGPPARRRRGQGNGVAAAMPADPDDVNTDL